MFHPSTTVVLLAALSLLAVTATSAPAAGGPHAVRLVASFQEGMAPTFTMGSAAEADAPASSTCYVLVPLNTSCNGGTARIEGTLNISLTFGAESVSTGHVRVSQVVNGTQVLVFDCKVPAVAWLAAVAGVIDCNVEGEAAFFVDTRVRLFVQHLPAAGQISAGDWRATIAR